MMQGYNWYSIHELLSPYRNIMNITSISDSNEVYFILKSNQPVVSEEINTRFLIYYYHLAPKLHNWFVDEDIKYELRLVNNIGEILLDAEVATLVRLRWANML
jgi:hypothetical protein